jgi:hypothetical protein
MTFYVHLSEQITYPDEGVEDLTEEERAKRRRIEEHENRYLGGNELRLNCVVIIKRDGYEGLTNEEKAVRR